VSERSRTGDDEPVTDALGEDVPMETGPEEGAEPAAPAEREGIPPVTPEEVAETAQEFVSGLVAALGLDGRVEATVGEGRAIVDVQGEGLGVLIGRRGQALDALQELTRTAVQRRVRSHARLLVDVEGYRARRRTSLAEYAREMADRAKERGTEIELEPMNAYERKVVHDAIADIEGASSFSEGEEPERKVIVRGE